MVIVYLDKKLLGYITASDHEELLVNSKEEDWIFELPENENYLFVGYYTQFTYKFVEQLHLELHGKKQCLFQLYPVFPVVHSKQERIDKIEKSSYVLDALFKNVEDADIESLTAFAYDNILIAAHGEGIHIKLGKKVLCALSGNKEESVSGTMIEEGCTSDHCRRMNPKITMRLRCPEITCNHLYLLSCNSGNIVGEVFDSSSSLARGFLESGVKNFLGCMELHDYSQGDIKLLDAFMKNEYTMSEICYFINQVEYRKEKRTPFCVFTNETEFYPERKLNLKPFQLQIKTMLEGKKVSVFKWKSEKTNGFYTYKYSEGANVTSWLGNEVIIFLNKGDRGEITVSNSFSVQNAISNRIKKVFIWSSFWLDYFHLIQEEEIEQKIQKSIRILKNKKECFIKVKEKKICRHNELIQFKGAVDKDITNLQKYILKYFVTNACVSSFEKVRFLEEKVYIEENRVCNRCQHNCYEYAIKDDRKIYEIQLSYCGTCGIRSIAPAGYQIESKVNRMKEDGLELILSLSSQSQMDEILFIYIEIYDKAEGVTTQKILEGVKLINGKTSFCLQKDLIKGKDLHTYRGIVLNKLEPIYFRGRFSV